MIAIKEIVGCVTDSKGKLTHVVHYEDEVHRPVVYEVKALGLDDLVGLLNTEDFIQDAKRVDKTA